jgi:hypothetical protein
MDSIAIGDIVRLPHGEIVKVEIVYDDGEARVRRIVGDRAGTIAVCRVSMLLPFSEYPFSEDLDSPSDR